MKPKPRKPTKRKVQAATLTPEEFKEKSLALLEKLSTMWLAGEENRNLAAAWFEAVKGNPAWPDAAFTFYKYQSPVRSLEMIPMLDQLIAAYKLLRDGLTSGSLDQIRKGLLAILTVLLTPSPQPMLAGAKAGQAEEAKALHAECCTLADKFPVGDDSAALGGGMLLELLKMILPLLLKWLA